MDNETEIIEKYIQNLSKGMKDYLAKDAWSQKLLLVEQKNKLTTEQISALKTEVLLVMIGIENHSDFKENIQKNIVGISSDVSENIAADVEKNIFAEIEPLLDEIEKTNNEAEKEDDSNLRKDKVLGEIENPTPVKPILYNPAGKNPILDAQHNLPEQVRKTLISSAAVPSRGPILNNLNMGLGTMMPAKPAISSIPTIPPTPVSPMVPKTVASTLLTQSISQPMPPKPITPIVSIQPVVPVAPIAPVTPVAPVIPSTPVTPPVMPTPSITPQPVQPIQPVKPPQAPVPSTPEKYSVDPYREPLE